MGKTNRSRIKPGKHWACTQANKLEVKWTDDPPEDVVVYVEGDHAAPVVRASPVQVAGGVRRTITSLRRSAAVIHDALAMLLWVLMVARLARINPARPSIATWQHQGI